MLKARGKNQFQLKWLDVVDKWGDKACEYLEKTGEYKGRCKWCRVDINGIANMGHSAVKAHVKSKSHEAVANLRKHRNPDQIVLTNNPANVVEEEENVDDPVPGDVVDEGQGGVGAGPGAGPAAAHPSSSSNNNRNIMRYFTPRAPSNNVVTESNNNNNVNITTLGDKVARAEILFILHGVNSNHSFSSLDHQEPIVKAAFPDSKIASLMVIGRQKGSYVVTEALGPYFLEKTLEDIRRADAYVIGLDSATTRHLGLSKGLDLKIRYFSEKYQTVVDRYISTCNLGHETSTIMKNEVLKMLNESKLELDKVFMISRDNPNVMKGFGRLMIEALTEEGNKKVLESPCTLHPTHTGFKEGIEKLELDVTVFCINIFGWFKLSTARREDMMDLRRELGEEDIKEFFLRPVDSRWLTTKKVVERIIKHWRDITEYFVIFLPNSTEKSHIDAVKTQRYRDIVKVLKNTENSANLARLKFVVYLANKTEVYLKTYQAVKPMAYRLFSDSCHMIQNLMTDVMKEEKIPDEGKKFVEIDFEDDGDEEYFKSSKDCDFGPSVLNAINECSRDVRPGLRSEFKTGVKKMIQYLVKRLPVLNKVLKDIAFTDPMLIDNGKFATAMMRVAKATERFTVDELDNLDNQLKMVKLTKDLPAFDEDNDTYDTFWLNKVIGKLKETQRVDFAELTKLVKLISIYPNSQAWLERGFNDTKWISDTRQSVSVDCMKYLKVILDVSRFSGGPEKLQITQELIDAHVNARRKYRARLAKEKKDREEKEREERRMFEDRERKRKYEEEKKGWDDKVKKLKSSIEVVKSTLKSQEEEQMKAFEDAKKFKKANNKETAYKRAELAAKNIVDLRSELDKKSDSLVKLMSKKPRQL